MSRDLQIGCLTNTVYALDLLERFRCIYLKSVFFRDDKNCKQTIWTISIDKQALLITTKTVPRKCNV